MNDETRTMGDVAELDGVGETVVVRRDTLGGNEPAWDGLSDPDGDDSVEDTVFVSRAPQEDGAADLLGDNVFVSRAEPVAFELPAEDDEVELLGDTVFVSRAEPSVPEVSSGADDVEFLGDTVFVSRAEPSVAEAPSAVDEEEFLGDTVFVSRDRPPASEPHSVDVAADLLLDTVLVSRVEPPAPESLTPVTPRVAGESPADDEIVVEATVLVRRDESGAQEPLALPLDDTVIRPSQEAPPAADLPEADFSEADLSEADLSAADLAPADLPGDDSGVDRTRVVRSSHSDAAASQILAAEPALAAPVSPVSPASPASASAPLPLRRSLRSQHPPIALPEDLALSERARAVPDAANLRRYRPRSVPPPPSPGPTSGSAPATRSPAPAMRSVQRASHRWAWIALGATVGACAVSITGLVAVVLLVW